MSSIRRRLLGVGRLELRRQLGPGKVMVLLFLSLAPIAIMALRAWLILTFAEDAEVGNNFGNFYHGMIVLVVLFFGCAVVFLGQVRGELDQRSWHYSLLTPIERWQLVVGKYGAGLVLVWSCFVVSTGVSRIVFQIPQGLARLGDSGVQLEILSYMAMSAICCCAYGAFFLGDRNLATGPRLLCRSVFWI